MRETVEVSNALCNGPDANLQAGRLYRRAIDSLLAQELADWELLIIDDGSPDETAQRVEPFLSDARIRYDRLDENGGLGAALNLGLTAAQGELIAYLPSDDVYYAAHLRTLAAALDANPDAVLAFSHVRHHYNRSASGADPGLRAAAGAGDAPQDRRPLARTQGAGDRRHGTYDVVEAARRTARSSTRAS